jgi:hypothetical protein
MKKFYLLTTVLMALFAVNVYADRFLYTENYEAGGVPSTWTRNGNNTVLSILGDDEGKYISFLLPQENGRSAHNLWGAAIYDPVKEGLTEYSVSIDFQFEAFGNNQFNGEIAVFSGEKCPKTNGAAGSDWSDFNTVTPNCFFSLSQNSNTDEAQGSTDHTLWYINGDKENTISPVKGDWYNLLLTVNMSTREVSFELTGISNDSFSKKGSKIMAEDADMYASGFYIMNARYQSRTNVDNIIVSVPGDYANDPVIALTGVQDNERTYTISFQQGETLHVIGTDGNETTVSYFDAGEVAGAYVYKTTTSGTLKAYTTMGSMTSATIEQVVDCTPIQLPLPTYQIVNAEEGVTKTWQFKVDNSTVDMRPEIFMDFSFKSESGKNDFVLENQNSGVNVKVEDKGVLTVTTKAMGYVSNSTTITNDSEFEILYDFDYEHMTGAEVLEKGFVASSSNVNDQWNTRGRLMYSYVKGTAVGDTIKVYPWGATLEDNKFEEYEILGSTIDEEKAHQIFAPVYVWFDTVNLHFKTGVGIISPGRKGDDNSGAWVQDAPMGVDGLTDNDFIVVGKITSYGTSVNPTYYQGAAIADGEGKLPAVYKENMTEDDAAADYAKLHKYLTTAVYTGTTPFTVYRVDTSVARIYVLRAKNSTGINEIFNNDQKVISDHNAPIYNLNGVQVKSLQKGIYIKQGKKFVVK